MRIGLFTDTYTPDINGVVSSIVTLQKELEKNGHDVFVITNHKAARTYLDGNVLRLPGMELKWLYGYKLSTPYHFSAKEEIKKMRLDVIHVHTEFGVGMFGRIVAKYLNIPLVTTYHTMYEDYTHYINRFEIDEVEKVSKKVVSSFSRMLSDSAQAVISPSEKTKETLVHYGVKTPIYVIPTGLNFDHFRKERIDEKQITSIRNEYGVQKDDKLIIFVGRIAPEKSIDIQIEGFRYIKDKKIKLMIVGDGPQLEELKKLVSTLHLEEQVIFTGKKSREEVPVYYACADCFVSASLTETQGMTYIEALASGLPVFARWDDVLTDLVIENKTGFLFEDAQDFAKKVEMFFQMSKEKIDAIKENAQKIVKKYDANVFCSKVMSVYYQAIDDFEDAYEVVKIKTLDDYVKLYVENDKEDQPIKVLIRIDDYFQYKIRLHTRLDRSKIREFQKKELVIEAYRAAIRKLKMKDYTKKEIDQYLQKNYTLEENDRNSIIEELEEKGYINDQVYLQMKMEKLQISLMGKGGIRRYLVGKGLSIEDVDQALKQVDDETELHKAKVMAEKLLSTIRDKSRKMKKQTIIKKLISLGFDSDIAKHSAEDLDYGDEEDYDALVKTIQKAYRNYQRKYEGKELYYKIIAYCVQKGFKKSEVEQMLTRMEWYHA